MHDDFLSNESQRKIWMGKFGDSYVDRNYTIEQVNELFDNLIGISIEELFYNFFNDLDRNYKILEIGCNVGLNLSILKKLGFKNLFGLEPNNKAIMIAKERHPEITFFHSTIEEFQTTEKFDLVFTSDVLIHINPKSLQAIIKKIYDLSTKLIFGFEYFSNDLTSLDYRGHSNIMWKQNFPKLYCETIPDLILLKKKIFPHKQENLEDIAFLLKKP